MHCHCEIVIPPLHSRELDEEYITAAVSAVMSPFDENRDDEDSRGIAFWDWYVIGGRWAGAKLMERLGKDRIDAFYEWLRNEGITVYALNMGKEELSPAKQIPMVDDKWTEMFPEAAGPCPIFRHSNDQYREFLSGDIATIADTPRTLKCARVIFAGHGFTENEWGGALEPKFMLSESVWNGYNYMPISWDGTFGAALNDYLKTLDVMAPEYVQAMTPTENWIVVTVDYHS